MVSRSIGIFFLVLLVSQELYAWKPMTMSLDGVSKYLTSKKPIFVAGGTRGVGLEFIKQLVARGNPVHALVRSFPGQAALADLPHVKCIPGDAFDAKAVQKAMEGCIAAVTTLGGGDGHEHERVDYVGNSNVIEQAGILGVERLILITSVGCGATQKAIPPPIFNTLEHALLAKSKAEKDLKMYTNMDWTILRPGGLKNDAPTGKAILTEDILASGSVTRADVASQMMRVLGSTGHTTRREFTVIDPSFNPEYEYHPFTW